MRISDSEIARVIEYLSEGGHAAPHVSQEGSAPDPALLEAIRKRLRSVPDVRVERVNTVRAALPDYEIAAEEIARKMIGRAIGDRLR